MNTGKKFALAGFVVVAFIGYSVHQRTDGSGASVRLPTSSQGASGGSSTNGSSSGGNGSGTGGQSTSYKDGQYTGSQADAYYGYIQVQVTIKGGKISDVQFLQYPNDRSNSIAINQQAMPYLRQEAIQAQSANVDVISGATDTSQAFVQSLSSALSQAQS